MGDIYEAIQKALSSFTFSAAIVPGGDIYFLNDKGEICCSPGSASEKMFMLDPTDTEKLGMVLDEINHPDTSNVVDSTDSDFTQIKKQFDSVTYDVPVVSLNDTGEEEEIIGRVFSAIDKETGTRLVLLMGYGIGSMSVLTAVHDADGNINRQVVVDCRAYARAINEFADLVESRDVE